MPASGNQISVAEAKRRFSELIDRVASGEQFIVSRRGKPALALVAPGDLEERLPVEAPLGIAAFVGALADEGDVLDEIAEEAYANRRKAKDRAAPRFH